MKFINARFFYEKDELINANKYSYWWILMGELNSKGESIRADDDVRTEWEELRTATQSYNIENSTVVTLNNAYICGHKPNGNHKYGKCRQHQIADAQGYARVLHTLVAPASVHVCQRYHLQAQGGRDDCRRGHALPPPQPSQARPMAQVRVAGEPAGASPQVLLAHRRG